MSTFEFNLKALISKATEEYKTIATATPVTISEDDDTTRGEELDRLLAQQELEKKELWGKLYALEDERVEKNRHVAVGKPVDAKRKELLRLMTLDQQLVRKVTNEMAQVNIIERENEAILDIKYRDKLVVQNKQLEETIDFLRKDLDNVKNIHNREKRTLKECKKVEDDLRLRLKEVQQETNTDALDLAKTELAALKKKYDKDLSDMSDFLDKHYPVHPVDNAGPLGDECELKMIVEQLLNQAYQHPDNPYLPLVPGTYWTPYIQTLVKAGVAKYHPDDSQLLRLEDFRLE